MDGKDRVWVCIVCGYVHRGPEPPESCPLCGASSDDFEAAEDAAPAAAIAKPQPQAWRCLICGYVHEGDGPPDACPVCGVGPDDFEPIEETAAAAPAPAPQRTMRIVVIGGGIAGVAAVETIRDTSPEAEVLLVSKEADLPYLRLNLTRLLAGEIAQDALTMHPEAWFAEQRITLLRNAEVTAIFPDMHEIEIDGRRKESYDKLILAFGAHAFVPPIPGAARSNVFTVRTLEDAKRILAVSRTGTRCVCIGGGILGLETAGALAKRGVHVTLLESYEWLLPRQLNREAGEVLHHYAAQCGVAVRYQAQTAGIVGESEATGVLLGSGETLPADFVLITTGIRPNTALARKAGLDVNQGIVVDAHLTTSHPDILAAGDASEHRGVLYGLWEPARYQGTIAAMNALGVATEFAGLPRASSLKVLGVDMFSAGIIAPQDGSYIAISERAEDKYTLFVFRDNLLAGAILLGESGGAAPVMKALKSKQDCSAVLAENPSASSVRAFLGC